MQKHHGKTCMTTVDLTHGYWQVPLTKESRQYTAFLFDGKLYQFKVIPFGLKTSSSGFIRALSLAFRDDFTDFLTYYIDDLLITSYNFEQHLVYLKNIFQRLSKHNFTLDSIKHFSVKKR